MIALLFIPLYDLSLVVSDPHSTIVQVLTYFPYSAPVTALLRYGFRSLNPLEAAISIAILFTISAIMLRLAVKLFQHGSIAYTTKVSLKPPLPPGRHGGDRRSGSAPRMTAKGITRTRHGLGHGPAG